jgi:uncharacterized protein (TIGR01777 family)
MKILVTGSTGFIGTPLVAKLRQSGHDVVSLARSSGVPGLQWDPLRREIDLSRLENFDAVIHLAGESINGKWSRVKKNEIKRSRKEGTAFLVESLLKTKNPPKIFISASAIGYYGDRDDEILNEESLPGNDFLADVCKDWERAAKPLEEKGIRVVYIRNGLVLHPKGGALKELLLPFKFGLGGAVGSGRQWWSWIALNDLLAIYEYALMHETVSGAVNGVAPNTVTNKQFVKTLGKVMRRPAILPLPAFAISLIFGEMGRTLLLKSQRVIPKKITDAGFTFQYDDLEKALIQLLE